MLHYINTKADDLNKLLNINFKHEIDVILKETWRVW